MKQFTKLTSKDFLGRTHVALGKSYHPPFIAYPDPDPYPPLRFLSFPLSWNVFLSSMSLSLILSFFLSVFLSRQGMTLTCTFTVVRVHTSAEKKQVFCVEWHTNQTTATSLFVIRTFDLISKLRSQLFSFRAKGLLESLEGRTGKPRLKPPFPANAGPSPSLLRTYSCRRSFFIVFLEIVL